MINASGRVRTKHPVTFLWAVSLDRVASTSGGGAVTWLGAEEEEGEAIEAAVVALEGTDGASEEGSAETEPSEAAGGIGEPRGGGEVERSLGLSRMADSSM